MSFVGKVIIVGIVGAACYWQFVYKKENPNAKLLNSNPIEAANKDYVEHKAGAEEELTGKKATHLQDTEGGAQRTMTKNK